MCAIASRNRATFPMKKLLNERKLAAVHTRLPHARTHGGTHARTHACMHACSRPSIYFKVKRFPYTHYDLSPCRLASYLPDYSTRRYHYQTREPKRALVVTGEEILPLITPTDKDEKRKKLRYRFPVSVYFYIKMRGEIETADIICISLDTQVIPEKFFFFFLFVPKEKGVRRNSGERTGINMR